MTGAEFTTTLETTVTAEQIDQLGHMNVSHYARHAIDASTDLLALLGMDHDPADPTGPDGAIGLVATDPLTAHRAEQLEGASLAVRSLVLDADADEIRLYHELIDTTTGQLSATFVYRVARFAFGPWEIRPFPNEVVAAARARRGVLPDRGRPRTLGVDDRLAVLSLAEARDLGLELGDAFTVTDDLVGPQGRVPPERVHALAFGPGAPRAGAPGAAGSAPPVDVAWLWATMESRHRVLRAPRAGDRVQAFSAEVHLTDKVFQRRSWVYDVEVGDLVAASDVVGLAFDPTTRRATTFAPALRAELEARYHPELR